MRILGGIPIDISFMQFSTQIDGFEQNDSQGFENSYNSYEQYPITEFFHFHHLPKLYFGFNCTFVQCMHVTQIYLFF